MTKAPGIPDAFAFRRDELEALSPPKDFYRSPAPFLPASLGVRMRGESGCLRRLPRGLLEYEAGPISIGYRAREHAGAGDRNRTRNPLITNQLRYRCATPALQKPHYSIIPMSKTSGILGESRAAMRRSPLAIEAAAIFQRLPRRFVSALSVMRQR